MLAFGFSFVGANDGDKGFPTPSVGFPLVSLGHNIKMVCCRIILTSGEKDALNVIAAFNLCGMDLYLR